MSFRALPIRPRFCRAFFAEHGLTREEVAYCGDDLNDLAGMALCGFVAAPADATPAVAARADYRCPRRGGEGAVRDAVEEILRREGKLAQAARAAFGAEL